MPDVQVAHDHPQLTSSVAESAPYSGTPARWGLLQWLVGTGKNASGVAVHLLAWGDMTPNSVAYLLQNHRCNALDWGVKTPATEQRPR